MGRVMNVTGTNTNVTGSRNSVKPCQYRRVPNVTGVTTLCARVRDAHIHARAQINNYFPRVHTRYTGNTGYNIGDTRVSAVTGIGYTENHTRNSNIANAFTPVYASLCLKTTGNGLGRPVSKGAQRRNSFRKAAFLCAARARSFNGRAVRERFGAAGSFAPVVQPARHRSPLWTGVAVLQSLAKEPIMANTTQGASAPRKTKPLPFFSYDGDKSPLFTINENVPFDDVLDQAHCFIISAEAMALRAAEECDNPEAWGCLYMVQIAAALIESMSVALVKEAKND